MEGRIDINVSGMPQFFELLFCSGSDFSVHTDIMNYVLIYSRVVAVYQNKNPQKKRH